MKILKRIDMPIPPEVSRQITCPCGSELEVCLDDMSIIASDLFPMMTIRGVARVTCPVCETHINLKEKEAFEYLRWRLEMSEKMKARMS